MLKLQTLRKFVGVSLLALLAFGVQAESLEKALEAFDFEEYGNAAKWLKPWAEKGEAEAQYRLGIMYENGYGVTQDTSLALKWYRRAAAQHNRGAKRRLVSLRKSESKTGKESVATQWYQDLAEDGDTDAQYNLGFMFETGWSVPVDDLEAANWYELAAEKDHSKAQLRLGMMYIAGVGVKQSEILGAKWIGEAARNGEELAELIEKKLLEADPALRINEQKVVAKLRSISTKNEEKAKSALLSAYKNAQLRARQEKAKKEARLAKIQSIKSATDQSDIDDELNTAAKNTFSWYKRKAELGDASAQFILGRMYETGDEVELDLKEAVRWYKSAAEQENSEAQYYLGMLYAKGLEVMQNEAKARRLLEAAAAQGHLGAKAVLAKTQNGNFTLDNESIAVWWLQKFAQKGSAQAQYNLGYLYEHGRGVDADAKEARKWFELAAQQGHVGAKQHLAELESTSK
jgi:TPR repeat protein